MTFKKTTDKQKIWAQFYLLFFIVGKLLQSSVRSAFRPHKQTGMEKRRTFRRRLPTTTSTKTGGNKIAFYCGGWLTCYQVKGRTWLPIMDECSGCYWRKPSYWFHSWRVFRCCWHFPTYFCWISELPGQCVIKHRAALWICAYIRSKTFLGVERSNERPSRYNSYRSGKLWLVEQLKVKQRVVLNISRKKSHKAIWWSAYQPRRVKSSQDCKLLNSELWLTNEE